MIRNIFILLISLILLAACNSKKPALPVVLESNLLWGQPAGVTAEKLQSLGWKIRSSHEGQIFLYNPVETTIQDTKNDSDQDEKNSILATLFSQNNKLVIVKIYYQDNSKKTKPYLENFLKKNDLTDPVWNSPGKSFNSPSGNKIHEITNIFDSNDSFIVIHQSEISVLENLKKSKSDIPDFSQTEIEIRLLGKKENQGLNKQTLIDSVKKGIK